MSRKWSAMIRSIARRRSNNRAQCRHPPRRASAVRVVFAFFVVVVYKLHQLKRRHRLRKSFALLAIVVVVAVLCGVRAACVVVVVFVVVAAGIPLLRALNLVDELLCLSFLLLAGDTVAVVVSVDYLIILLMWQRLEGAIAVEVVVLLPVTLMIPTPTMRNARIADVVGPPIADRMVVPVSIRLLRHLFLLVHLR